MTNLFDKTKNYVENYPLNETKWDKFLHIASQKELLKAQEGFYYAVKAFPQMLSKLASHIEDSETRLLVIENLWEEHGQGDIRLFHTNSYLQYLQSLGFNKEIKDISHNPWIDEWIMNSMNKNYNVTQYATYLGGIEYIYARISKNISDKLETLDLYCEQSHYKNHSVLDYEHAAELLEVAIHCTPKLTSEELFEIFKQAIEDFIYMFEKMVLLTEIEAYEISQEKIAFYYGREDSSIERMVVERIMKEKEHTIPNILMICSGGENCIELLKMNNTVNITALDINPHQISLAKTKINNLFEFDIVNKSNLIYDSGKFEKLFEVLVNSLTENELLFIAQENNFGLKKLQYICNNLFDNRILEIVFTEEATKYSSKSFSEHFYYVFKTQIKNYYLYEYQYSNIGCVLGKTLPMNYNSELNENSSIIYFNGTFNECFLNNNTKYDVIDVSNISDWMNKEKIIDIVKQCYEQLNKNGYFIGRKLLGDYDWINLILEDCNLNMEIFEVEDSTSFYTQTIIAKKK